MSPIELRRQVTAWLAQDPDPRTRKELETLLANAARDPKAAADLVDRFSGRLDFGTAGLRGALGAGPNRMNRVVVAQAAAGLAAYLLASRSSGQGGVVIGYDARHGSDVFATDTAELVRGAGLAAYLLPAPLPTPVLAFAVRHLGCAAGVMVTASHNPPQDNGYKVFLADGSQIAAPADADIAAAIAAVGDVSGLPRSADYDLLDDDVVAAYVTAVAALPAAGGPRSLDVVYTPLHGVGAAVVRRVLHEAGFEPATETREQAEPDPDFPTVSFPNPEEPGALDIAVATAQGLGADVVIANDPDADRCAVAVPGPAGWRMLRGDELGALLADSLMRHGVRGTYATTIVSSSLLGSMCTERGLPYVETLTGFKWLGRVEGLAFGYEEALGYCVAPGIARDKDGISAMVLVLELAAALKAAGQTLSDRLDEIALRFGVHATDQLSVRVNDLSRIGAAMQRLRTTPPTELGGLPVSSLVDLASGSPGLPPTDGLRFQLAERARVVVRPSGTEPKLKCYLEVVIPVSDGLVAARAAAATRLAAIRSDIAAAVGVS
ncbi:MAG: phospho-sugar mutase [Nocardioidaceae bacterium]